MESMEMLSLLLLYCVSLIAYSHATPKINELFISPNSNQCSDEEYIEILLPPGATTEMLKDFAIVIADFSSILAYIDFRDTDENREDTVNDNRLVVLSNNVETPNLKFYNRALSFRSLSVQCIILIRRPQLTQLNLLELTTINSVYRLTRAAPLTNQNKLVLKQLAVDILVYQKGPTIIEADISVWVQSIIPQWRGTAHHLPAGHDDLLHRLSIARCDNNLMSGSSFRHDGPTPGFSNTCDSSATSVEHTNDPTGLHLLEQRRQNQRLPTATSAHQVNVREEDSVTAYLDRLNSNQLITKNFEEFFTTHPDRKWYRLLPNDENLALSSIRCDLCFKTRSNPDSTIPLMQQNIIPNIMKESGQLLRSPSRKTWEKITQHQDLEYHKQAVLAAQSGFYRPERKDVYEEIPHQDDLQATADKISLVYLEIKVGLSLNSHEALSDGLIGIGFPLGDNLNSRYSSKQITKFLGEKIHDNLIKRLIASNSVFSIMLDSSTDIGSVHTMLIYIRYIEDGAPVTKVLQLREAHDSSAQGMWKEIENSIKSEGVPFEDFVKRNCVAMATDGASNMMGQYSSLKTKIATYVMTGERLGRPFQHYHCANHKLALAYNDVLYSKDATLAFCKKLTDHCNNLARFYSSKSYKRRDEMLEIAETQNEPVRAFHRIQKVRWVPATQKSYEAVVHNFRTFMTHLTSMTIREREDNFPREAVEAACSLHDVFSDKNLLSTLHFHMDVIFELTKWAKWLERRVASVIDLEEWHLDVRSSFETMKIYDGHNLKRFLESSSCSATPCNSLQRFELSTSVVWKDVALSNHADVSEIPALSTTRTLLMDSFLRSFETRFPAEAISAFSVLLPSRLPNSNNAQWEKLGRYMVNYHGFHNSISNELVALKDRLITSQFYATYGRDPPEIFWSNAILEAEFNWTPTLEKVIHIALVQPSSTAQVEAGFSIVAAIKTNYRSLLSTPIVQDILRLKFNGPVTKYLPKYRLALDWLNEGHARADVAKKSKIVSKRMKRNEYIKSMRF